MSKKTSNSKILLVDDEEDILKMLELSLSDFGYQVTTVLSVDRAIVFLREECFDYILSDYAMPGRNGLDLLFHLKKKAPEMIAEGRFAFFSGSSLELQDIAKREGVPLIEKPLNLEILLNFLSPPSPSELSSRTEKGRLGSRGV